MRTGNVIIGVFLALFSLAYLSSCNNRTGRGKSTDIVYDSIVMQKDIPLLTENDSTLPHADVNLSFTYPVSFRDRESTERLQKIFKGTFFGSTDFDSMTPELGVEKYLNEYTARYQSLSNMYYEDKARLDGKPPMWYWYYMNTNNKILFQNDSLLSYAVEYSDYEGGAHGSYRITYTNINLNDLVTLSEEDLFVPGYYNELTEKILQSLMKDYNAEVPDSLLMRGFFTVEDIVPNDNFWLSEEGINYSYNQYEIAPYSMGVINVTVPYSELKDILLPESIVSKCFLNEE
ncbi:MAG: DUF3298 domain-containing protein [Fermentimonas sp.]|nr:DUF3298 domain-containing protein [Fermentimonas sp.]